MKYAAVVVGFAAAMAIGAVVAIAARSAASPFELVLTGGHEAVPPSQAFPFGIRHTGTFRSGAPFCPSGTYVDLAYDALNGLEDLRRFSCDDDTGTLDVAMEMWFEHKSPFADTWRIVGGSGRFDGLRGGGTYRGEFLSGDEATFPLSVTYRSTLRGFVAFDSVAPTIRVLTAKVTKLQRPAGTYSIRLTLMMRDNEPGNAVSYTVAIEPGGGGLYLAEKKGLVAPGKVTMTLRIRPARGARTVLLQLGAQDPVGNSGWSTHRLKLLR
jgi:hypothetical protein